MTHTRSSMFIGTLCGLAACSSTPIEDHFYSLVLAADDVAVTPAADNAHARLVVGPVELPDYLDQRGLVIQTGSNQVRAANHHLWAEPLEEAIAKVLVRDISRLASDIIVDREAGRYTESVDCRVRIEFDRFHATSNSKVVSSGRYWVTSAKVETRQEFNTSQTLSADGYAHAVEALRVSLASVAAQISATIASESACAD